MANLLKKIDECEYPAEFLVARLHGKKSRFLKNWEKLVCSETPSEMFRDTSIYPYLSRHGESGIWRFLRNEYLWVYERMNNKLRTLFEPYFVYHEISTLVICLRHLHSRNKRFSVEQFLQSSLLHEEIQNIFLSGKDFPELLRTLENWSGQETGFFHSLCEHYEQDGLMMLEMLLRDRFIGEQVLAGKDRTIKKFFMYLVDYHNCISLAKHVRWKIGPVQSFIRGGVTKPERFGRAYVAGDLDAVLKVFPLPCSEDSVDTVANLEVKLLSLITGELRRWSYRRTAVVDILFYLWEQFRCTRNISMILNTIILDDEPVREALVT